MADGPTTWQEGAAYVGTVTGVLFDFMHPRVEDVRLPDIAHALAMLCRFNGHTDRFYSVAQHSVIVSELCDSDVARYGLLHDASEAYLGDVISPLKRNIPGMRDYLVLEERLMEVIYRRFGLPFIEPKTVALADRLAVWMEQRDLLNLPPVKYGRVVSRPDFSASRLLSTPIHPLSPAGAKELFLLRARELGVE